MPFAFGIRNIKTKETWRARSGKTNWRTAGHAKLAWNCSLSCRYNRPEGITSERFDDQDLFEVFKYGQDEAANLAEAVSLLKQVIYTGALTSGEFENLEGAICLFLEDKE